MGARGKCSVPRRDPGSPSHAAKDSLVCHPPVIPKPAPDPFVARTSNVRMCLLIKSSDINLASFRRT